jgi:cytochrome c biogenesis protein CcmG/thiol:disulfide interchange protein DsbE
MQMKKLFLLLFAAIVSISSINAQSDSSDVIMGSVPDTELKTLDGETVSSAEVLEDSVPVLVLFWATWCKPCLKELDAINDVFIDWEDEIDFRIVAISIDDARSMPNVKPRVNAKGWEFEFYLDPNQDFKRLMNVSQPPHAFIINKEGEVVYQHNSYADGDEEELFEELKKYQ